MRIFIEIVVVSCVWLGGFAVFGFALAIWFASHASGFFLGFSLLFGAFGAAGELGYLLVERMWGRPQLPRWLLVGVWTLIAPTAVYAAMEIARQHTGIFELVVFLVSGWFLPAFIVAYIASWPFRSRHERVPKIK